MGTPLPHSSDRMISISARSLVAFSLLAILFMSGCGNGQLQTYPVSGQLKFEDGTVPRFGDIEFYNATHKINARGKINRDGTFTVSTYGEDDGAVVGKHRIVIIQIVGSQFLAHNKESEQIVHDHGKLINQRYGDYRTSDLECTIVDKENKVELTLEKNPNQTEDGLPK